MVANAGRGTGADSSKQGIGSRSRQPLEELIRAREAAGDRILSGVGVGIAVSSIAFATYAIASAGHPRLPAVLPPLSDSAPVNRSLAAHSHQHGELDPTTTGSLPTRADTKHAKAKMASPRYVVWKANESVALVEGLDGLREVVPGTVLPGAGHVLSIERSGTGWLVVTSRTVIGEAFQE